MIVFLTIAECLILKKKLCHSLNQSDWKLKTPEPVVTCLFTVLVQQIILNCNALPSLLHLLSNSRESIRKEACWTISNITAGNRAQIQVRLDALNRIKNYIGCRINGLFLITLQLKKKKRITQLLQRIISVITLKRTISGLKQVC